MPMLPAESEIEALRNELKALRKKCTRLQYKNSRLRRENTAYRNQLIVHNVLRTDGDVEIILVLDEHSTMLHESITELNLSERTEDALLALGINVVWKLCEKTRKELSPYRKRFRPGGIQHIVARLSACGLALGMKIPPEIKNR